jgi:hypothetical protein
MADAAHVRRTGSVGPQSRRSSDRCVISLYIDERIPPKPGSVHKPLSRPEEKLKYFEDMLDWWGDKTVDEIAKENCRKFTSACKSPTAARNRLEYFRGAVNLAHEYGLLRSSVKVHLPPETSSALSISGA